MSAAAPALFERDGELFVPSASAASPWAEGLLHGGPTCGLLAHGLERTVAELDFHPARLTVDMFRPVPARPLALRGEIQRQGKRIVVASCSLMAAGVEVARASGVFLKTAPTDAQFGPGDSPAGPAGLDTTGLFREVAHASVPPGFHTSVETRWVPQTKGERRAIWFHMPMALIAGETTSPLCRAASLADYANAVSSIGAAEAGRAQGYINVDCTLYLVRLPEGEWLCIENEPALELEGLSVAETRFYDEQGRFGRISQARLASAPPGSS